MILRGVIKSGVHRGEPLVRKYFARIKGIIGFEPFPGTMNLRLPRNLDLKAYATRTIEHKLKDGSRYIEAYMAPAVLRVKGEAYECWAFRLEKHVHGANEVEIIARHNIHQKFGLKDDDEVDLELFAQPGKKEARKSVFSRLSGKPK